MRKKSSPAPIDRGRAVGASRPLAPASATSRLPTAAALAVALAAFGCSVPVEDGVRPDPVMIKKAPPAPTPSPSTKPALNNIEPDPHDVDGDVAVVKPAPSVVLKPLKPYAPGPKPTGIKIKTGGKPPSVHPGDPFY